MSWTSTSYRPTWRRRAGTATTSTACKAGANTASRTWSPRTDPPCTPCTANPDRLGTVSRFEPAVQAAVRSGGAPAVRTAASPRRSARANGPGQRVPPVIRRRRPVRVPHRADLVAPGRRRRRRTVPHTRMPTDLALPDSQRRRSGDGPVPDLLGPTRQATNLTTTITPVRYRRTEVVAGLTVTLRAHVDVIVVRTPPALHQLVLSRACGSGWLSVFCGTRISRSPSSGSLLTYRQPPDLGLAGFGGWSRS